MPPLEERTEYPYQNIRVKNFPWGDGDKVSLFRNQPTKLLETQLLILSLCRPSCKFRPVPSRHTSFGLAVCSESCQAFACTLLHLLNPCHHTAHYKLPLLLVQESSLTPTQLELRGQLPQQGQDYLSQSLSNRQQPTKSTRASLNACLEDSTFGLECTIKCISIAEVFRGIIRVRKLGTRDSFDGMK